MHPGPPKPVYTAGNIIDEQLLIMDPRFSTAIMTTHTHNEWLGLWHAIGTNIPWYVNNSAATRKAMRKTIGRYG